MKNIKIKYVRDIMPIEVIPKGDWVDLRCAVDLHMKKGEYTMIPLGVAMELPKGYEAIVAPRSSTYKTYGILLSNSIGIIDESYCGNDDEWHFPAYATQDTVIPKNSRICQFRIVKHQPKLKFTRVSNLTHLNRGGLGSSGLI